MNEIDSRSIVDWLRETLDHEAQAIATLAKHLDAEFKTAVEWIWKCEGRVITCGLGKSGHIARKTAGTLSSTGTPSLFLHAAEAVHGDLGMVTSSDIVLLYTQSGETAEILSLFHSFRALGAQTILITGRADSSAAKQSDLVLDTGVKHEACAIDLAPTTSTTVMLALSDALAIAVMKVRGFTKEDFAKFHPSGTLGRRLLLTVGDVMRTGEDLAVVKKDTSIMEVLKAITQAGAGAACVVEDRHLVGFISDGDIRRWFLSADDPTSGTATNIMSEKFMTVSPELLAVDSLEIFQNFDKKIGEIPVVDDENLLMGLLVLKDLLRSGIV